MDILFGMRHPSFSRNSLFSVAVLIAGNLLHAQIAAQTSPGAVAWKMEESGTSASLRGIYSVDGRIAWASGSSGTVIRTVDGGEHWLPCSVPVDGAALDFRGVQAWDRDFAIVMASGPGDKSRLYKTTDGCKSWTLILKNSDSPDGFFDSFFADWSEEGGTPVWIGSLMGDPVKGRFLIADTNNSGATWTTRKSADLAVQETSPGKSSLGGFAASNSLFPANENQVHNRHMFVSGGTGGAVLWLEKPPGMSWIRIQVPLAHGTESAGIFSIASHGEASPVRNVVALKVAMVAVGGDYAKPNEGSGTAAWSDDNGMSWHAATKPPHGYRSGVAFGPEPDAWIAVGTSGSDVSRDDGKTWTAIDDRNWNAVSLPFAVGPKGRVGRLER